MRVIPPITIADAQLTSSDIVEVAPAAWSAGTTYAAGNTASIAGAAGLITVYRSLQAGNLNHAPASNPDWWESIGTTYAEYAAGTTYAIGDRVIVAASHLVYESLVASNIGQSVLNEGKWREVGPTNKWAMFDTGRSTATTAPVAFSVVIEPGARVDSLALLGMRADAATVEVEVDTEIVFTRTLDLITREVVGWYTYFFAPFETKESAVFFDLPPFANPKITITITPTSGVAELGAVVVGQQVFLGHTNYSAESDVLNFSTVERDFDSQISTLIPRRNVPKTIQRITAPRRITNIIRKTRTQLNAVPAVWSGMDDSDHEYFEALLILGIYKRFSINISEPEATIVSLELEEI